MRLRRVSCKLCGHRGSVAYKWEVRLPGKTVWICNSCYDLVVASADPGTAVE
jgi:hypothetical protein